MRILVGDNETTGLGGPPQAMAVEIAIAEIDEDCNVIELWETLINPGIPIQEGASRIHGITDAEVATAPTMAEAFAEIAPEGFGPVALICHNVRFDKPYFEPHLQIAAELCTLELARRVLPNAPNHRLGTLREHLGLKAQAEHQAAGDILIVIDLLKHLIPYTGRSLKQLIGGAAKPNMVYTMPFGKHKGTPIGQLDVDYRNWLLQQQISNDLRYTLEQLQKAFA